jgi:LacI family transcriptional regulator, repressor for deo operon, udp, cdd, tsx, nupC, and nupG
MTASIDDVARRAGVSIATVSRSLRGLRDVSPTTRERVVQAARDLNYVPSPQASGLASGKTMTVGVAVPFVSKWFFGQVVSGAESVLSDSGYDLLLYNLGDMEGRHRFFRRLPVRKRVDALMVLCLPMTDEETEAVRGLDVPVAVVGAAVSGFASVRIDDIRSAERAVGHLLELGHTRIGLIAGTPDEPMRFTAPLDRRRGYQAALARAGVAIDPRLDVPGSFTVSGGVSAMEHLLSLPDRPTAVFAESDEMALGALRAIRGAGLRVPEDISVIGFDDHEMAELVDLTTVAQPVALQGQLAARALLAALGTDAVSPEAVVVPTTVVERGTTARLVPSSTTSSMVSSSRSTASTPLQRRVLPGALDVRTGGSSRAGITDRVSGHQRRPRPRSRPGEVTG